MDGDPILIAIYQHAGVNKPEFYRARAIDRREVAASGNFASAMFASDNGRRRGEKGRWGGDPEEEGRDYIGM